MEEEEPMPSDTCEASFPHSLPPWTLPYDLKSGPTITSATKSLYAAIDRWTARGRDCRTGAKFPPKTE